MVCEECGFIIGPVDDIVGPEAKVLTMFDGVWVKVEFSCPGCGSVYVHFCRIENFKRLQVMPCS